MSSFTDLSAELKLSIIEFLGAEDNTNLLNLSRTSKALRTLVAPCLFRSLLLRNGEKSGSSILAIAKSPHAEHVQQLKYRGTIAMPLADMARGSNDPEPAAPDPSDFPESVEDVLSHLARFPRLETLGVEFKWDPENEDDEEAMIGGFYSFDDQENDEACAKAEDEYAWRALMARSYSAIARNAGTVPQLKSLELNNVVPKVVTVWKKPGFVELLGQLERFKITLRGGENGAGWHMNTLDGYLVFVESLGTLFFDHLRNVRIFGLAGTHEEPPGLEGMRHVELPLSSDKMPALRVLKFKECFIGPNMRDFICGHAATLESIELEDCASGLDSGSAENPISWAELFDSISKAGCRQLKDFVIPPTEIFLEYSQPYVKERINELAGNTRLFAYKALDGKYGFAMDNEDANFAAYERGEDPAAWDRLLAVIEENRRRVE
jgi:hypothetical protein